MLSKVALALIALFTAGATHYAGFISEVPFQILSIAGPEFAGAFISIFAFYVAVSIALARFVAIVLISVIGVAQAIILRITQFKSIRFAKAFLRMQKDESISLFFIQALATMLLLNSLYFNFELAKITPTSITVAIAISIAALLRTYALPLSPRIFLHRYKNRRRSIFRRKVVLTLLTTAAIIMLSLSFYTGNLRAEYLRNTPPLLFSNSKYTGNLNVLVGNDKSTLAFENVDGYKRYILFSERFSITLEPPNVPDGTFRAITNGD